MERTRIALVGVGAIGGAVAADLFDLGRHELLLCGRTPFDRLEVAHPAGVSRVEAELALDPEAAAGPVPWVLLAVKATQVAAAKRWLDGLCGDGTRVAVLQNGVDHEERVAPLLRAGTAVVPVVVQLPAEKVAPGRVRQRHAGSLFVPDDPNGRAFAELFVGARATVEARPDFVNQQWWKLLVNAASGGIAALTLRPSGISREPDLAPFALALMREITAVANADGATLPDDAPERLLRGLRPSTAAAQHLPSIAVDRREGRPTEWEVRNAVVGRIGRRHGVPTPLNDAVTALLRAADVGFTPSAGERGDADGGGAGEGG